MKISTSLFSALAALTAVSAVSAPARAQEAESPSMVWGWCQEPDGDPGWFPSGWYSSQAVEFTENLTQKFDGCYVTSMLVAKGYYIDEEPVIDIFLAHGEERNRVLYMDEPFLEMRDQPFPGQQNEWAEFQFPEPYLITAGQPFFAIWRYFNTSDRNLPLVSDGISNENRAVAWTEGYDPAQPDYGYWNNALSAGALCIRLRISGDNLPDADIVVTGIEAPRTAVPEQPMEVSLAVSNAASATITEVEVQYAFPGAAPCTVTVDGLSLAPGEAGDIQVPGIVCPFSGNTQLDIEITSVNGKADADNTNNMISAALLCLPEGAGYQRNVVVEEGTGTWCGNCPRGMVAMRRMAEEYPDRFLGIAVHSSSRNSKDPMEIEGYMPFLDRYISLYPSAMVDRVELIDPSYAELLAAYLAEAEVPALAQVTIDDLTLTGDMVFVNPSVRFAVPETEAQYGWAYVITEDNVGPYWQTNYYKDGSLPGWDYTDPMVEITYDEVAVAAQYIMGNNTIPENTVAGDVYSLPMTIDGSNVKDWYNAHLTVMVINKKTGYIENAARSSFSDVLGVDALDADRAVVRASEGAITLLSGDSADVLTLSGIRAATLRTGGSVSLPAGLYIVRTASGTRKLTVK